MSLSPDLTRAQLQLVRDVADGDVVDLKRFASIARQYCNKARWQILVQRRTTTISRVLRLIQRAAGAEYRGRSRNSGTWQVFAFDHGALVVAAEVPIPAARTFADLVRPLQVRLLRPDLLDEELTKDLGL